MNSEPAQRRVIFDTDAGADDAWALQMMLKTEKTLQSVKVLAITTVHGNTSVENAVKNTYRILDGLGRTDVNKKHEIVPGFSIKCMYHTRFQFTKERPKRSFQANQPLVSFLE